MQKCTTDGDRPLWLSFSTPRFLGWGTQRTEKVTDLFDLSIATRLLGARENIASNVHPKPSDLGFICLRLKICRGLMNGHLPLCNNAIWLAPVHLVNSRPTEPVKKNKDPSPWPSCTRSPAHSARRPGSRPQSPLVVSNRGLTSVIN